MEPVYHFDHFYEPPIRIENIELIQVGRMFCAPETRIEKHLHLDWFELTTVIEGEGTLITNDVRIPIKRDDIYLSFPADEHAIYSNQNNPLKYDYLSFYPLDKSTLTELEKIMLTFQSPSSRLFFDDNISMLIKNAILKFQDKKSQTSDKVLSHLLNLLIIYLIRNFNKIQKNENLLEPKQRELFCYQLMNYIDTHIFSLKNLADLEQITNFNYSYISKLFHKTTGQTLINFYQNSRLKKANLLIREKRFSIGEIANLLNYSSLFAFSKAYKQHFGFSPTATLKAK